MAVTPIPWITILTALIALFASKKSGASNTRAMLTAGLAGAGAYYVTHETDWGKANLGALDGVVPEGDTPLKDEAGNVKSDAGSVITTGGNAGKTSFFDVLKGWGATGTAAVLGTGAAATGSGIFKDGSWFPWALGIVAVLFVLK